MVAGRTHQSCHSQPSVDNVGNCRTYIKLASVASDALGLSGRDMLNALIDGSTDAASIANMARGKMRAKRCRSGVGVVTLPLLPWNRPLVQEGGGLPVDEGGRLG